MSFEQALPQTASVHGNMNKTYETQCCKLKTLFSFNFIQNYFLFIFSQIDTVLFIFKYYFGQIPSTSTYCFQISTVMKLMYFDCKKQCCCLTVVNM